MDVPNHLNPLIKPFGPTVEAEKLQISKSSIFVAVSPSFHIHNKESVKLERLDLVLGNKLGDGFAGIANGADVLVNHRKKRREGDVIIGALKSVRLGTVSDPVVSEVLISGTE